MANIDLAELLNATQAASGESGNPLQAFLQAADDESGFKTWVQSFCAQGKPTGLSLLQFLAQQVALIDELIEEQVNAILHHKKFQQLESSWRSLKKLCDESYIYPDIKLKLLNISWAEVCKDITRAQDFDQSQLFQRIYNDEFGTPGGEPYGLLVGDYYVSHRPYKGHKYNDLEVLQGVAQIAAASFAPFICGAAPQLFGLDDYQTLGSHLNFQAIFQQQEYIKWRAFRQQDDARFVSITLPRIILRKPHQSVAGELPFKERCERPEHYLWGNAAFAFASVIIREYGEIGWFAQIRGVPRGQLAGGVVTGYEALPIPDGTGAYHILTDVVITDAIEREFSELGLMALCQCYGVPLGAFHSNPSVHMPKKFDTKSATANARISAMLQQVLCASRFAHYLKVMIRDKVGSYTTEKEIEGMLTKWLNQYTTGRDDLSWEMRAKYPLRDVRLQVKEMPGMPGQYTCVIFLKPHYIAENLVSELKLTTELSQAGIGSRG